MFNLNLKKIKEYKKSSINNISKIKNIFLYKLMG